MKWFQCHIKCPYGKTYVLAKINANTYLFTIIVNKDAHFSNRNHSYMCFWCWNGMEEKGVMFNKKLQRHGQEWGTLWCQGKRHLSLAPTILLSSTSHHEKELMKPCFSYKRGNGREFMVVLEPKSMISLSFSSFSGGSMPDNEFESMP